MLYILQNKLPVALQVQAYTKKNQSIISVTLVFFQFCQQHKIDRSANYFFPFYSYVKFLIVTDKFGGICYSNVSLIICIKRTNMSRYYKKMTLQLKHKNDSQICQIWQHCTKKHD